MAAGTDWEAVLAREVEGRFVHLFKNRAGGFKIAWGFTGEVLYRRTFITYDREFAATSYYLTVANNAAAEVANQLLFGAAEVLRGNELGTT